MSYKTPGVYVKEISIFPPSVAEVKTAIPAFIGYTEFALKSGKDLTNKPTKIKSLVEYAELFGGAPAPGSITVDLDSNNSPQDVNIVPRFYLYNSLRLFFANGGGECYIVSVGDYTTNNTVQLGDVANPADYGLSFGLKALEKYDEPTLIVFPDAILLSDTDLHQIQRDTLAQCAKLGDRFGVFDLQESTSGEIQAGVDAFRNQIGINHLKYGAAYTPHLQTNIPYSFAYENITFTKSGAALAGGLADVSADTSSVQALDDALTDRAAIQAFVADPVASGNSASDDFDAIVAATADRAQVISYLSFLDSLAQAIRGFATGGTMNNADIQAAMDEIVNAGTGSSFGRLETLVRTLNQYQVDYFDNTVAAPDYGTPITAVDMAANYGAVGSYAAYDATGIVAQAADASIYNTSANTGDTEAARATNAAPAFRGAFEALNGILNELEGIANSVLENGEQDLITTNSIYARSVDAIEKEGSILPPSGAMVGIYTMVDGNRGVWKAPANVSLNAVVAPTAVIDDTDQQDLNVDVNAGKSINAIRSFTGKGTLVWGARTLAGNDNEWRYVPVRRFFNMVEESVKKSTSWAVFEPNDANTWSKVGSMISNYLNLKWREGALQGASPDDAYFVKVGLGLTMTPQDVLEGRMIVEIGMAVVRPAEFIILKFSHKLVES
jgi:phage tail sheath protein FI